MTGGEKLFWSEVASPEATERSIAVCYALMIALGAGRGADFWRPINEGVNSRLDMSDVADASHRAKIDAFRLLAWSIYDAASAIDRPARLDS